MPADFGRVLVVRDSGIFRAEGRIGFKDRVLDVALPVFLVDNVATTGATLAAARQVFGFGTGLVFADASPAHLPIIRS